MSLRLSATLLGALALTACGGDAAHSNEASFSSPPPAAQAAKTSPRGTPASFDGAKSAAVVKSLMDAQYPTGYDSVHQCWKASSGVGDEALDYCMRPQAPHLVETSGGREMYVHAANANDINDIPDYAYSSVDPGLMGAFRVRLSEDGSYALLSASPTLEFGTAGDCGCSRARFVRVSDDLYAWTFVSGGTWQGVVSTNHVILAPADKEFADIAGFPEVREAAQDVQYTFDFQPERGANFYPISLTRKNSVGAEKSVTVPFDNKANHYLPPTDF